MKYWELYGRLQLEDTIVVAGGDFSLDKKIIFPNARKVYFWACDENFIYYNLDKHVFPNIEEINLICTSLCESSVQHRFISKKFKSSYDQYDDWNHIKDKEIIKDLEDLVYQNGKIILPNIGSIDKGEYFKFWSNLSRHSKRDMDQDVKVD